MNSIRLTIPGAPKGKGRHRTTRTGHTFTPKETATYENLVKIEWQHSGQKPLEGALCAMIIAYFPIPKSRLKQYVKSPEKTYPTVKPDADNIAKIILDSLNGLAYRDDSDIVHLSVYKMYGDSPKTAVDIWEL